MSHIQTRYVWIQERVGKGHIKIVAVPGARNPSDILTKSVSVPLLQKHMKTLNFVVVAGSELHRRLH